MNLDVAGEFIWMAATLCYLKSCELLPNIQKNIEEEEDPREVKIDFFEKLRILQNSTRCSKVRCITTTRKGEIYSFSESKQVFSSYIHADDSTNLPLKQRHCCKQTQHRWIFKIYKKILDKK